MKPPPNNPEFVRFTDAMRTIVKVSKTEILKRIEEDKAERGKPSSKKP